MSASFEPVIVLLAAGKSSRFNGVKLLAKVNHEHGHSTMLQSVLNKIESLETPLIVATGEYHHLLKNNTITGADFHFCSDAHLGMGHTISQVTKYVCQSFNKITHIMFVLADQVAIDTEQYQQLLNQARLHPNKLLHCLTSSGITAPCVFPKSYWPSLAKLTGDKGAKSIILNNLDHSKAIEIENANIDIDQQEELIEWNAKYDLIKN